MVRMAPPISPATLEKLGDREVVASISGGKDSACLSLWLTENGIPHRRVFADTGWEHPLTYEYLRGPLAEKIGAIEEVRGPRGMADLVRFKGMFPARIKRFCTEELKVFPLREYFRALPETADYVNAVGIRAAESQARSQLAEWEWSETFDCEVWRPLIRWTEADVIDMHTRHGLRPNPLYLKGARRVGCWPCIFASKEEIRLVAQIDPARIKTIRKLERELNKARKEKFAARGEKYRRRTTYFTLRPDGKKHLAASIDKVVRWATTDVGGQLRMAIDTDDAGCMRWGLCETSVPVSGSAIPL